MHRRAWLILVGGMLIALSAGCSGQPEATTPEVDPETQVIPDFVDDISLLELLTKPRAELAQQADEVQAKIIFLEEKNQQGDLQFRRLPELRLSLATPVFREAKYSAKLGFSVPPYLVEDVQDSGLALHLARFGDIEAARKLVDPEDTATLRRIEALAGPKNYPVEWTRLVSLLLHNAQIHLVTEEQFKPARLITLHQQLAEVLDPQAKAGPLGAALLPRGHGILKHLATGWRAKDLPELAEPAEAGLNTWGPFPTPTLPIQPGKSSRAEVERLLGVPHVADSRVLQPASVLRALDVLGLPLPGLEAENLVACFDTTGTCSDLVFIFRPRLAARMQQPGQIAYQLEEGIPLEKVQTQVRDGLTYRRYLLPGSVCEVALTPHSAAVGGIGRISNGQPTKVTALPRQLGNIFLDRSFEQNRLRIALHQQGNQLLLDDPEDLKQVHNPAGKLTLLQAILHRAGQHDVPARLTLHWTAEEKGHRTLGKLAFLLGGLAGMPHIESIGGPHDGHLALSWKDERTRWTLRVPNKVTDGPELEIADLTLPAQLKQHAARLQEQELSERKKRLATGAPQQRLERNVEGVTLGSLRGVVDGQFPANDQTVVLAQADTLAVRFAKPAEAGFLWQELVARFDSEKKLLEVRFRFRDAPGKNGATARKLEAFKKKYGAPHVFQGPWTGVWSAKSKAVLYRWQDDQTLVTWQQDSGGVELTVRDCPAAHPEGVPLDPLALLDRGPEGCQLGARQAEVLARFKGQKPAQPGGPWQLTLPKKGAYDTLLVWFKGDRVVRVLGRHSIAAAKVVGPAAVKLVANTWNSRLAQYGWPRRQDVSAGLLEGQGNHDDRTCVRVFWRKDQGGGSLFTEWTELAP